MKDSNKRSIVKTITFRITSIITLSVVTYLITGNLMEMTQIVLLFQVIQTIIYYFHERFWQKTSWCK